jgi:general secretion pathway protein C
MMKILTRHFWIVHLLFIACVAWLVSYLFVVVIQDRLATFPKAGPSKRSAVASLVHEPYEKYSPIPERNIFNPAERGLKLLPLGERKAAGLAAEGSEGGKTAPPGNYILIGTITGPKGYSWAIIQEKGSKKQQIYRIRGNIGDGKIIRISRNQMQIEREGKVETLMVSQEETEPRPMAKSLPSTTKGPSTGEEVKRLSANRYLVNREDVTAAVGDVNKFMTQARLRPHFERGKPSGYSVSEIVSGSLMEKLGLKNNDIIKKVNGMSVSRPEEVMQAYAQLQRDSNIEVEIERGGRTEVFRYEIR